MQLTMILIYMHGFWHCLVSETLWRKLVTYIIDEETRQAGIKKREEKRVRKALQYKKETDLTIAELLIQYDGGIVPENTYPKFRERGCAARRIVADKPTLKDYAELYSAAYAMELAGANVKVELNEWVSSYSKERTYNEHPIGALVLSVKEYTETEADYYVAKEEFRSRHKEDYLNKLKARIDKMSV